MIPLGKGSIAAILGLAMAGKLAGAPERPPSSEEEERRQQRHLEHLARQQHSLDMATRRQKKHTGTSLLDKARRAKARL